MLQNTPQVVKNLIILNVLMYFGSGLLGTQRCRCWPGRTRVRLFSSPGNW